MTKLILAALALAMAGATPAFSAGLDGAWARGDGNARVQIAPCGSDVCATNTWIKPGTPSEKTGDKLVMSIHPASNGHFSGTAFDPQRNMTYDISLSVKGDSMVTKGCVLVGLVCKDVHWTRID